MTAFAPVGASQLKALRRVDRFDNFLARMEARAVPSSIEEGTVIADDAPEVRLCHTQRGDHLTDASLMETSTISSEDSYIGCVSLNYSPRRQSMIEGRNGPIVAQTDSLSAKKTKDFRRNNKFQRFVAAKQNQRAKTLRDHSDVETLTANSGEGEGDSFTSGRSAPTLDMDMQHQETAKNELNMSPTWNSEESPTSVIIPSMRLGNSNAEPPELPKHVAKKKIFNFIRVESNNGKGIIQSACKNDGMRRQSKNLTWWDDTANKHKPFTLTTDESADWDDNSTWNNIEDSNCSSEWIDRIDDFLVGRKKRTEEDENTPCKTTEFDFVVPDKTIDPDDDGDDDSVYHHIPLDQRRCMIIGNLLDYYKGKLDDSFSQVVETSKNYVERSLPTESVDMMVSFDTIISMTEDDGMADLFQVDLFDGSRQDEDAVSLGDRSVSTHQACNDARLGCIL